jgi:hypothetical protein
MEYPWKKRTRLKKSDARLYKALILSSIRVARNMRYPGIELGMYYGSNPVSHTVSGEQAIQDAAKHVGHLVKLRFERKGIVGLDRLD